MSTPRRRPTGGIRRPQVAGRPRPAQSHDGESDEDRDHGGGLAVDERAAEQHPADHPGRDARQDGSATDDADREDAATEDDQSGPAGPEATNAAPVGGSADAGAGERRSRFGGATGWLRRIGLPKAPTTRAATAVLLVVTILLAAAAVFFAVSWARIQFSGSTTNTALTDVGATAAVSEQIGDGVKKIYSFDFARMDQAEADARASITGEFTGQFDQIFGNVRKLAPKQQAVVTATIPKIAVSSIDGDRATAYVFVDQVINRVDDAGKPAQGAAAARLRVDAQYVDGAWKVANMQPA